MTLSFNLHSKFFFIIITGLLLSCSAPKPELLQPVNVTDITVDGEIGRRIDVTINKNLLAIDMEDQFLRHFRQQKEKPELRDDFCGIGMFIDGLVTFAAYKKDSSLTAFKDHIINELLHTQDSTGYMGVYTPPMRKKNWDNHESAYIIMGLVNDYHYFKNQNSLRAAQRLAENMVNHKDPYICGFEQALLALYRETGDKQYYKYCVNELGLPVFKGGSEHHSTHVYGYIARAYAQLLLYEMEPDPLLLYRSKAAIENMITFHAMDITGTIGSWEHWNNTCAGIGACGETCASAYALRMLGKLLQIERNSLYGDMMERIIYNALFAAQSPDGRQLRYFTPFEDERVYYPDDYFCCPNNFRRIMAELPAFIYYQAQDSIFVNLYNESQAELLINGNKTGLSQTTDYPASGKVIITVSPEKAETFTILLRIPSWCSDAHIGVNGVVVDAKPVRGHFYAINRQWRAGDEINLSLPMELRFISGTMEQYNRAALMRGPVVFCLSNEDNHNLLDARIRKQQILVDPQSISAVVADSRFRPGGAQYSVRALAIGGKTLQNTRLILSEFINPDGIKTFFDLPDSLFNKLVVEDEFLLKDKL
ncbi:MAG TPA: glycoside hydrolase family 127 protein [bacterium]|nr:glycoside hydrolase family 127 protein [bacterium]HPN45580.1 glycoside hydrolase family 127 protein [bacterium]